MARVPATHYGGWKDYLLKIFPGLFFCFIFGAFARWLDAYVVPEDLFLINYVLIALLLGLLVKNLVPNIKILEDGIDFSAKICLFIGIVLLGARLNLIEIFQIGSNAIIMVAISITMCILLCGWLGKKFFANERWGHLVGAGIGVCGVSAIIALAPVIKARQREILAAIGASLLTDVMVLIGLPSIGHYFGFSDTLAGFIAGVVPSNTAQCVAIGYAYSDSAGAVATIVKSSRNAFMPIVILLITYFYLRKGLPVGEKLSPAMLWSKFPKFIVGFLIAATVGTLGLISAEGIQLSNELSKWFFVTCFVGIGAGIDIKSLGGQDLSVLGLGFLMTFILAIYAFLYSTIILIL